MFVVVFELTDVAYGLKVYFFCSPWCEKDNLFKHIVYCNYCHLFNLGLLRLESYYNFNYNE